MDIKTIAKLAEVMTQHSLTKLEVQEGETSIRLAKESSNSVRTEPLQVGAPPVALEKPVESETNNAAQISAPMPGTFYTSPAPEMPPFVKEGDHISVGTVVCIVEAMKVMNEVKSELSGVVSKVLCDNASPVEFGQPLFEIKAD
jgi:acetyl-CoA carboxylase biotin carboxyl carrier protein